MEAPSSFARTYEQTEREATNIEQVRKICKALNVEEKDIFDEYMSFLSTDYVTTLLEIQSKTGLSDGAMNRKIGMSKGQYKKWVQGKSVPSREAVKKILQFLEEYEEEK
jgi:DNA-binding transcriptional regulator YiaG